MFGASHIFSTMPMFSVPALPAAIDVNDLGQVLPIGIGIACTLGIVVVGLLMSRKRSPAVTVGDDLLMPRSFTARNPLADLAFPAVILLMIGGGIFYAFMPAFQEFKQARDDFGPNLQSKLQNPGFQIPNLQPVQVYSPKPFQMPVVQPIDVSKFQPHFTPPPPPPQPHIYIDRRGMIHTR